MNPSSSVRRALVISAVLHVIVAALALWAIGPSHITGTSLVDIEVAPIAPKPEALPAELPKAAMPPAPPARPSPGEPETTPPGEPAEAAVDAGVDAAIDAAVDARHKPDARPDAVDGGIDAAPDIAIDAEIDAEIDAPDEAIAAAGDARDMASDGATVAELGDAGPDPDAGLRGSADAAGAPSALSGASAIHAPGDAGIASSPVAGIGSGAPGGRGGGALDTAALAAALAAGSTGTDPAGEPAVEGAPTTAGTAANLLAYFPDGHIVTALIRFDRLRGTEWAATAERLLHPLPDYRGLFGGADAKIADKLETLVISTPAPRDAAATTLVARTRLPRAALRDLLSATSPVRWSVATGGLIGKRTAPAPGDRRVLVSPFQGWFVLAQPGDLGGLTAAAKGNPDRAVATAPLPPWLAQIRTIEAETGDPRGPAAVVTLGLHAQRLSLASYEVALGIASLPTPDRVSMALELVAQGWLVRGNLRFASEADALELIAAVQKVQQRIADSTMLQLAIGKRIARVVASLAFARNGVRVSYATSISIADARSFLAAAAQQLDAYFTRGP